MNLVELKASFDPTNAGQLSAAINFLSAIGAATEPKNASQQMASCVGVANVTEIKESTGAIVVDEPNQEASEADEVDEVVAKTVKKRTPRKAKPKTEEQAVEVAETVIKEAIQDAKEEAPEAESAYTLEDLSTELSKKVKEHRAELKAKLNEYGVPNIRQLQEGKYADFMEFMKAL